MKTAKNHASHALVLGLGVSGEAAARLLARQGHAVTVVDAAATAELRSRAERLSARGIAVHLNAGELPETGVDRCVVSPGVPMTTDWVRQLRARGVPVLSELEFGWAQGISRVVAVTGSNGKSTAVKFLVEALQSAGARAAAAGNYGPPVSALVLDAERWDWLVVEVSSFQLEGVERFRPDVGVLLNVHPNHLDRHVSYDEYFALKCRLFAATGEDDACLVPEALLPAVRARSGGRGRWTTFGTGPAAEFRWNRGWVEHRRARYDFRRTYFDTPTRGDSVAALVAAAEACGIDPRFLEEVAPRFVPLPHRFRTVLRVRGVTFIDDSKATNLAALRAALDAAARPVRVIAGGVPKEKDFDTLKEILAEKATGVYLIGEAAQAMFSAWSKSVYCVACGTLERAVARAWSEAKRGDTVLLSPGCASFDQFRSYRERGKRFAGLVHDIAKEVKECESGYQDAVGQNR